MNIRTFIKKILMSIRISKRGTFFTYVKPLVKKWRKFRGLLFEVHLVEHCNLNCKGCVHFSPLAEKEYMDYEQYKKDMLKTAELLGKKVRCIHLMGGEPLLHPQVTSFMKTAAECFPKAEVKLLTNAILLANQPEEFWNTCRDYNIIVGITKYPIKIDYAPIEKIAASYNVKLRYGTRLTDKFTKFIFDLTGSQDIKHNYNICNDSGFCNQLKEGRFYICAQSAYINHLNQFFNLKLNVSDKDWIDIYKVKSGKEILDFTNSAVPFCRYCNLEAIEHLGETWGPSQRNMSEWFDC